MDGQKGADHEETAEVKSSESIQIAGNEGQGCETGKLQVLCSIERDEGDGTRFQGVLLTSWVEQ